MNAIITVVGHDKVGIIAGLSAFLAERGVNIDDISQTILSGDFVMVMKVSAQEAAQAGLSRLKADLEALGSRMGVSISLMHEAVFQAMHRI
jgi:ACT domain-containing protein